SAGEGVGIPEAIEANHVHTLGSLEKQVEVEALPGQIGIESVDKVGEEITENSPVVVVDNAVPVEVLVHQFAGGVVDPLLNVSKVRGKRFTFSNNMERSGRRAAGKICRKDVAVVLEFGNLIAVRGNIRIDAPPH